MYNLHLQKVQRTLFIAEYQFFNFDFVNQLKKDIDNNIGELSYKTNVKGKITNFDLFIKNEIFISLLKESTEFMNIFKIKECYLAEAWGNILGKGEEVVSHKHEPASLCGILYLTEGGPGTCFPEFNKFIEEKIGKIVFFNGDTEHFVPKSNFKGKRYTVSFNFFNKTY